MYAKCAVVPDRIRKEMEEKMIIRQTAGRDSLGDFAPKFAQLNDDVLFGEVWSRKDWLSLRDRFHSQSASNPYNSTKAAFQ